jgi:tripartite-type tricarboxylate transporter receptor subunit TctC
MIPGILECMKCALLLVALALMFPAHAQDYPNRPIKMVVPFPPGGGMDGVARPLAEKLAVLLGQPLVIENRPGASGNVGAEAVARTPADGYTLMFVNDFLASNPAMYKSIGYDSLRDFTPLARVATVKLLFVVHPSSPARSFRDLASLSKSKPVSLGTPGVGSAPHLLGELLNLEGALRSIHVPYKGSAPAVADAMGGQVDVVLTTLPSVTSHLRSGKLRGLAVTSERRSETFPDLPTLAESGVPGIVADIWYGLFARAGTPEPVLRRLQAATAQALAQPDLIDRLQKAGYEMSPATPEAFGAQLRADLERWRRVVNDAKIPKE